ncbi:cation/H(+) antiporter 4-like [Senna tora]|uniref:Cation/H(+) antiporter 4-like n=1 Tax=Senna tora TaxID=362788 RepID=A0A834X323_9FABA|nr:cation/H(+) antiporter 4-like [Senna tora]
MDAEDSLFLAYRLVSVFDNDENYQVCVYTPPNIVSDGLWGGEVNGRTPMKSSLTMFELQAGLILGPSLDIKALNLNHYKKMLFPYGSQDTLATVTSLGYVFFIFVTSVQMDLTMITRTGNKVWGIALVGLLTPIIAGLSCWSFLSESTKAYLGPVYTDLHIVIGTHSLTSFSVVACVLTDLKILNSELGRLALSSALVSDTLSLIIMNTGTALINDIDGEISLVGLAPFFSFVILVPLISRPAMLWVIKHTPEGRPVKEHYIFIIIGMVLGLGWLSVRLNQDFILGPFILGLSVPEGPPLGSALIKKIQLFGLSFLLPIFVTTCVMKVDLTLPFQSKPVLYVIAFILLVHAVKITGCLVVTLCCKMPFSDSLSLALILSCQGVVEVCLFNGIYDSKLLTGQTYGILMIAIMIIASIAQTSLKYLYDPSRKYTSYQQRNIMNLKATSELRMVACLHKQSHITSIIDFLDICHPTTDNPIVVDALHLIELIGRALPIFVPHRQKADPGLHNSYSDNVILAFDFYQQEKPETTVNIYTAISPPRLMHEDVCNLALDKLAAMVILPFHQRWSIDGKIESNDKNIRAINLKVLERAPCSVGILVARASLPKDSPLRLAMVFLGGNDDREALCLAKRAARDPRTNLVVYHLVAEDKAGTSNLENILDKAVLKNVRQENCELSNVIYREIPSIDGSQTTAFLRSIVGGHDYFIVGRRHEVNTPQTSGLTSWSEFPELGAIGDLLASSDCRSRASVLVVQQQESHAQMKWKF